MGHYETPDYEIILKDAPFELRKYKDFYIVEYSNEADPAINRGFGTLFNYISSDNKEGQKIAMTIPVIEEVTDKQMKMAFVVPAKLWGKIPEPNNQHLSVEKFEHGVFATIRYSGASNRQKEANNLEKLTEWLTKQDYHRLSNHMLAFYNAPFVPPFLRRNEILMRVEKNE